MVMALPRFTPARRAATAAPAPWARPTVTLPPKPQPINPTFGKILQQAAPYMAPDRLANMAEAFAGNHYTQAMAQNAGPSMPAAAGSRMTVPEPITAIGDVTRTPYFKVGDGGSPEQVHIQPVGTANGTPPVYDNGAASVPGAPIYAGAGPAIGFANGGDVTVDPTTADFNAKKNTADAQQAQITANQAALTAAAGQQPFDAASLAATQKATNAQRATIGPDMNYISAEGNSLNAQQQSNTAQQAYLAEQQRANDAMKGETQQINAAQNNTADTTAVAQAVQARADNAYKYSAAGISQPQEVQTANGADDPNLPPGVVAKLETQGDLLTRQFAYSDKMRGFDTEAARIASAVAGTNVTSADIATGRVKLTADQAAEAAKAAGLDATDAATAAKVNQLGVTAASNAAQQAGENVNQAQLNQSNIEQPPAPGLVQYTDPTTGLSNWVTPEVKVQQQQAYAQAHPQQVGTYSTSTYGHLSDSQVLGAMVGGTMSQAGARDELMLRGYSEPEANSLIVSAYQSSSGNSSGGGIPLNPTNGQPVTP